MLFNQEINNLRQLFSLNKYLNKFMIVQNFKITNGIGAIINSFNFFSFFFFLVVFKKLFFFSQAIQPRKGSGNVSKLPWIENVFLKYQKRTKLTINNCFALVSARIVFSSKKMLPSFQKDVLPAQ